MTYKAILNGNETTAKKAINGKTWLVGGDVVQPGQEILILSSKNGRAAWFKLKGCFLIFSDFEGE